MKTATTGQSACASQDGAFPVTWVADVGVHVHSGDGCWDREMHGGDSGATWNTLTTFFRKKIASAAKNNVVWNFDRRVTDL